MNIRFPDEAVADAALKSAGFSVGSMQRSDPRGVMFGDVKIAKWRNLTYAERGQCHARYLRDGPAGSPVDITIAEHCPKDGAAALLDAHSRCTT